MNAPPALLTSVGPPRRLAVVSSPSPLGLRLPVGTAHLVPWFSFSVCVAVFVFFPSQQRGSCGLSVASRVAFCGLLKPHWSVPLPDLLGRVPSCRTSPLVSLVAQFPVVPWCCSQQRGFLIPFGQLLHVSIPCCRHQCRGSLWCRFCWRSFPRVPVCCGLVKVRSCCSAGLLNHLLCCRSRF